MKLVWGTTTCAQVALCAGTMLWAAWRLKDAAKVDHQFELAEAAFAYGVDWRYVDLEAGPDDAPPDRPPARSASMKINNFMSDALDSDEYWHSYYQPVRQTFHSAHIVRHILPKAGRTAFDRWLKTTADRMRLHFPKPKGKEPDYDDFDSDDAYNEFVAPHRGVPVPPQLLDPAFKYRPAERKVLVAEFLSGLDPKRNRYLRKPKAMLELGFTGVPYRLD